MERLPIEIKIYIQLFLDDKNAREARLVCVDWFEWIKYSKFTIPFANQRLLEQITQRLSTYSWLVELKINRVIDMTAECLIRNISQLTQLKSLQIRRGYIDAGEVSSYDWHRLSGLTNLETWDCDGLLEGTVDSLLGRFSKLKYSNQTYWQYLSGLNTNLESINAHNRRMSDLPPSLTHLHLQIKDDLADIGSISRLTKLKALSIDAKETYAVDAKYMTGLNALTTLSMNINGLEQCTSLTQLYIDTYNTAIEKHIPNISALVKLQKLTLIFSNTTYDTPLSSPELPQVTSLTLSCNRFNLSSLPSSLARLGIELCVAQDYSHLSHLVHLTKLELSEVTITNQSWIVGINCLTQLISLDLFRVKKAPISLRKLRHLTKLSMTQFELDEKTLLCMTDLQYLHIVNSPFTQEHWQSLEQLSKLTTLIMTSPTNEIRCVNGTSIAHLPLRELIFDAEIENFWSVVTKLTDLNQLQIPCLESSEQLLLLAPMKLTGLRIKSKVDNATGEYLTCLTSLQELIVYFKQTFIEAELKKKLTRLYSTVRIK